MNISDFDEQTADDWDVDMSGYYEEGAGDKDARDYLTIRQEKRRRDGIEATDRFTAGLSSFTLFAPASGSSHFAKLPVYWYSEWSSHFAKIPVYWYPDSGYQ